MMFLVIRQKVRNMIWGLGKGRDLLLVWGLLGLMVILVRLLGWGFRLFDNVEKIWVRILFFDYYLYQHLYNLFTYLCYFPF